MAATIEWFEGGVEAAFAQAASGGQPLFLYWGAAWCPPCNRLKAGLFARPEFIEGMGGAIAVALDGDDPGAQAMAARLKLRSYPTMVLYRPDGREVTRLQCQPDSEVALGMFKLALECGYTAQESLLAALSPARNLTPLQWNLLSFYAWDCDEGQVLGDSELLPTLVYLSRHCPAGDASVRLDLLALAAGAEPPPAVAGRLLYVFSDLPVARANMDILTASGVKLILAAAELQPGARKQLADALGLAAEQFTRDETLSLPDRMAAMRLQVRLARFGVHDPGVQDRLREQITTFLHATDRPHERHVLIHMAAGALAEAGLPNEADVLLRNELDNSLAPYYFVHGLAANARRRGDTMSMLNWYDQAWNNAKGPATRLQWGATYFVSLVDSEPEEAMRIERVATGILADVRTTPDAFEQRNRRQLARIGAKLDSLPELGKQGTALQKAIHDGLGQDG